MISESDETVTVLEDSNDGFIMSEEQNNHRIMLESHSFIEVGSTADNNQGPDQPHHRATRMILSSDEEADDDNINKKRRRRSFNESGLDGDESTSCSICFEAYTISGSHRIVCLKCGHLFGQSCIERWIRTEKAAKCPQCKTKARITDIRRLYVRAVKALDTTELECLKEMNNAYRAENDSLRLENERLKEKIIERLNLENAQLRARIALKEKHDNKSRDNFRSSTLAAQMIKDAYFSLLAGPIIQLSSEPGSRSLDANGECFVVACKITVDGREDMVIPVHSRKPRCCRFSPFDRQLVLSTGEDKTLCVTRFNPASHPLQASGWCCCWLSEDDVAVGLINGEFQKSIHAKFSVLASLDRFFVHVLIFAQGSLFLFVTSLKECVLYHHMQPYVLISDEGSINSFCYDQGSNNVMLTFAPSQRHETKSFKKLTRVIRSAFWTAPYGLLSAVYDETNSHVVLYDWIRKCPIVVKRVNDMIVDIKEIVTSDMQHFQLGCLSETAVYFLKTQC
ncbi:E3 ubiquitin-protein ligase RFWD3 [Dirofilaria immitis]|nr:E3 ubiquitin-protein ligase RFWD3 [Dirofilaria immitis]